MKRLAAALLALIALPAAAQDWCSASRLNATERTICTTASLQWRDEALNRLWEYNGGGDGLPVSQRDWLAQRNACGTDIACIADAYDRRIASFDAIAARPATPLRPWCDAARLNPTESTICATPDLADFDAALVAIYGEVQAQDAAQTRWLRNMRDACGRSVSCIRAAYVERIRSFGRTLRTR